MTKLWKKPSSGKIHPFFQKYTTGTDNIFDIKLFPFDIQASIVHIKMLQKIGILTKPELSKLLQGFEKLKKKYTDGKIKIRFEDEDCHTVIENEMIALCGDTAKKIHTGRSRNDQVLVAIRLYTLSELQKIQKQLKQVLTHFLDFAEQYQKIPFPGYSHTRQAMLSSIDHYILGYIDLLLSDFEYLNFAISQTSKNPLGTGAGYGSSFALDREMTTEELDFSKTQINSLAPQLSRGKCELCTLDALVQLIVTLGKFSQDIIFFTSEETSYFTLSDIITTGSSMMPQKRNPDGFEILRGYVNVIMGNQHTIQGICKNSFTGYNRDFQLIKKPLFESLDIVQDSLKFLFMALKNIVPNQEKIEEKIDRGIFSVDIANTLVQKKGIPFRDAYHLAMKQLGEHKADLQENIASKISLGAPGNTQLKWYKNKIKNL